MARDRWHDRLEAYLDGELDPVERTAFEAETRADAALQAELEHRRVFREQGRRALAGALPDDLADLARGLGRQRGRPAAAAGRRRWRAVALAAALTLALVAPALWHHERGTEGPRFITTAGPVTAIRFGEEPGATAVLEAGCYDLAAGRCR